MIKKITVNFFVFCFLYSSNTYSSNIAVFNLEFVFNEINSYKFFIQQVEIYKNNIQTSLKVREQDLIEQNNKIENSSLILNVDEMNEIIQIYQKNLSNFQKNVQKYNEVINLNIDKQKNFILNKIATICKNISIKKNFDIILTENDYFLSSENIDISNLIITNLNNLNLILEFNEKIND